jgi:xanthine dehydrogenase accessory factor
VLIERAGEDDLHPLELRDAGTPAVLLTRLDAAAPKVLLEGPDQAPSGVEEVVARVVGSGVAERVGTADGAWLVEATADDLPEVHLFGAGHVGRALVTALAPLPCRVRWIDHRPELFREPAPAGVEAVLTDHPLDRVAEARVDGYFLVMTPSHDVDCDICEAVLRRGDFAFLGLIGSATKRARFEKRWRAKGMAEARIRRLVCPIGLPGIGGKEPAVIAASTAAQLLQAFAARTERATPLESVA